MENPTNNRADFLRKHGVDPSNQHIAVQTLTQLQRVAVARCDEACIGYLRKWVPELRGIKPKHYTARLSELNAVFSALFKTQDKLQGLNSLTYGLARKMPDGTIVKKAFEINYRVLPELGKNGIFRLDVDHKELDVWPANVKIKES